MSASTQGLTSAGGVRPMTDHKIASAYCGCNTRVRHRLWGKSRVVAQQMVLSASNDHERRTFRTRRTGLIPVHARRFRDHDYFVTMDGCIYRGETGVKLRISPNSKGYLTLRMCENGVRRSYRIHRMVWECWHGPIAPGMEINHKDFDKLNPRLSNLELMTHAENVAHAAAAGRMGKRRVNG